MTLFWPFHSFDAVPVVLLQLKTWERKNRTVTIISDPTSVTAEFEVWICRSYGETVGVNRYGETVGVNRYGETVGVNRSDWALSTSWHMAATVQKGFWHKHSPPCITSMCMGFLWHRKQSPSTTWTAVVEHANWYPFQTDPKSSKVLFYYKVTFCWRTWCWSSLEWTGECKYFSLSLTLSSFHL